MSAAGNGTPSQLLTAFLEQQGVLQAGRTSAQSISTLPAAWGEFTAGHDANTTLGGVVAFVSHNGANYRILLAAPSARGVVPECLPAGDWVVPG
ncbi:MAG: hypothetical protein U0163_14260 [Gemmatimonadaceae bacterium]